MGIWDTLFGKKKPDEAQTVASASGTTVSVEAFLMGVDIEELYINFGEMLQASAGGVSPNTYALLQKKIQRIQQTLASFALPADLSAELDRFKARIERNLNDLASTTPEDIVASQKTGLEIGQLMGRIRKQLDDVRGLQYDTGIFAARLTFCCRILRNASSGAGGDDHMRQFLAQMTETYQRELRRTGEVLVGTLIAGEKQGALEKAFSAELIHSLQQAGVAILKDAATTPAGLAAIERQLEAALGSVGIKLVL
jgi:hypothetical protein